MNAVRILLITFALLGATGTAPAQAGSEEGKPATVSVDARGDDVRNVLYDLFKQQGASFVVQTGVFYNLYLNLESVPFEVALKHICRIAGLAYEIQDGIYVFKVSAPKPSAVTPPTSPAAIQQAPIDPSALEKTLTLRLAENDIRTVMRAITAKTEVPILVADDVPSLKVNAYFTGVTVREALNTITKAAGLKWAVTEAGRLIVSKTGIQSSSATSTASASTVSGTKAPVPNCDQCGTSLGAGWKYCPICGNYVKSITSGG
jgi:type II secretory pathway component GspD/PulD (secretin)